MQSRSSTIGDELGAANIKVSETTLVTQGGTPGSALAPATTVGEVRPEEDPFVINLDRNDPDHPLVCILHLFSHHS